MNELADNLWEEITYWQHHDEDRNLELINKYELAAATELDAARSFSNELKRRKDNDF